MNQQFDYEGARTAGYSDEEIKEFLRNEPQYQAINKDDSYFNAIKKNFSNFYESLTKGKTSSSEQPSQGVSIDQKKLKNVPNFDVEGALKSGYTPEEINEFLSDNQPKRSFTEKAGRVATQAGLGVLEAELLPYEIGVAPLASKDAQNAVYREGLGDELEQLMDKKAAGQWDEKDQQLYDHIVEQIKDPRKSMEYAQTLDVGSRSLIEGATGLDLHPEGAIEKAAGWVGFLKDPRKGYQFVKDISKLGVSPKTFLKTISPGTKTFRGLGAGVALEMAEEGNFGPAGTIGMAILGDVIGHSPKGIVNVVKNPKKAAANVINTLTMNNTKRQMAAQIAEDFKKSGIQIDAGTLTNSDLIKMAQARVAQSGLTGEAADNFRKELSDQITREYKTIADNIGEITFENNYQAAEAIKEALKVQETKLGILANGESLKEQGKNARSLQGRVSVEPLPEYEQNFLTRIAPEETRTSYQGGENLKTVAQDIKEPIKEEFSRRWTAFNEEVNQVPVEPQARLVNDLEQFISSHEGSLLLGESTAEARVLRAAQNLRDTLSVNGSLVGASLSDLIKTKRTLGDIANYEFGGSNFESAYKELVSNVDSAINRTLENVAPELAEQYRVLNAEYSNFKDIFEHKKLTALFEPKNNNYNSIYNKFASDPDSLRALEDAFYTSERGQELVNRVKRDYAAKQLEKPNITERQFRDLGNVLGPEFENDLNQYVRDRAYYRENPLQIPTPQPRLGLNVEAPQTKANKGITEGPKGKRKISEHETAIRKKQYNFLKDKTSDQILKQMDTLDGIRRMRHALEQTAEGKELFNQLSRYKIDEMITKKMQSNMTEQVKLGTFSGLLKETHNQAIAKELLGQQNFNKLMLLQKNAGRLEVGAQKFFNASKSGTTIADMGLIGTAATGILTGNPWLTIPAIAKIGGSKILSNLLFDKEFIKYLEEAILTNDPKKFQKLLIKMEPSVQKSILEVLGKDEDLSFAIPNEHEENKN